MKKLFLAIPALFLTILSCNKLDESILKSNSDEQFGHLKSAYIPDENAYKFVGFGYDELQDKLYLPSIINTGSNFCINPSSSLVPNTNVYVIESKKDFAEKVSKKITLTNSSEGNSYTFSNSNQVDLSLNEERFAVCVELRSIYNRYVIAGQPSLTNQALTSLENNVNNFVANYGAYFISEQTIGVVSYYFYIYDYTKCTKLSKSDLKTTAKERVEDLWSSSSNFSSTTEQEEDIERSEEIGYVYSNINKFIPNVISSKQEASNEIKRLQEFVQNPANLNNFGAIEVVYSPYSEIVNNSSLNTICQQKANNINNYSEWQELYNQITHINNSTSNSFLASKCTNALKTIDNEMKSAENGNNIGKPNVSLYNDIFSMWENEIAPINFGSMMQNSPTINYQANGLYGNYAQGGGVCLANIDNNDQLDMAILQMDDRRKTYSGKNAAYITVGYNLNKITGKCQRYTDIQVADFFDGQKEHDGADIAIADINKDGKMDYVVFAIDDPKEWNEAYYKIGFSINTATGHPARWSSKIKVNASSWNREMKSNHGAGIAIKDIDGNGVVDLLVAYVDDPKGTNKCYYNIGWNLNSNGTVSSWSNQKSISIKLGNSTAGCGVTIGDITGNGNNDLIVYVIDNNSGTDNSYISVGKDLNEYGNIEGAWSTSFKCGANNITSSTDGVGIAIGNINGDNKMDILTYHIDDSSSQNKGFLNMWFLH